MSLDIRYSRPAYVTIDASVSVKRGAGYTTDILDVIKGNVEDYLASLSIGDDVPITGVLTAVTASIVLPTNPTFKLAGLTINKQGETPGMSDIEIPFDAVVEVGNVTVTEVS